MPSLASCRSRFFLSLETVNGTPFLACVDVLYYTLGSFPLAYRINRKKVRHTMDTYAGHIPRMQQRYSNALVLRN